MRKIACEKCGHSVREGTHRHGIVPVRLEITEDPRMPVIPVFADLCETCRERLLRIYFGVGDIRAEDAELPDFMEREPVDSEAYDGFSVRVTP